MSCLPALFIDQSFGDIEKALLLKDRSFPSKQYLDRNNALPVSVEEDDDDDEAIFLGIPTNLTVSSKIADVLIDITTKIINGQHIQVLELFNGSSLSHKELLKICLNESEHDNNDRFTGIRKLIINFIEQTNTNGDERFNGMGDDELGLLVLLLGITYLELYCQSNYTGPEFNSNERQILNDGNEDELKKPSVFALECDGHFPYNLVDIPATILIGRSLISFVAFPSRASWRQGIKLDDEGHILPPSYDDTELIVRADLIEELTKFNSAKWWNARATVLHIRLLQKQSYEEVPTLWNECLMSFGAVLSSYAEVSDHLLLMSGVGKFNPLDCATPMRCVEDNSYRMLVTNAWIEWGLACTHFQFSDHGKKAFFKAKEVSGIQTKVTAALGKRTKYQREDIAQLFLYARSHFITHGIVHPEEHRKAIGVLVRNEPDSTEGNSEESGGRPNYEWEIGKRAVNEVDQRTGEEAAIREVLLDTIDTGAAENIILEGGPKFSGADDYEDGGDLHPLDQAVILALCLDVKNSNPVDGLTNEEMQPYVERVLKLAKNWMIHSTALLQRSWLEFERRKTADRAMLQIQALIDQHTTRLTIFQSTFKSIEESAPSQDRLLYLYQIIYPSQFELKRDLAIKYLQCQVFMSALNYFKELEMWDEVVTCYQLMQKPHRAELVVREQLKISESPSMVTALADLTGKEDLYEHAWAISKGRYPRAKRTLGKICHDRGDFAACCKHLDQALAVQPLIHATWYLKGISCMKLNWWEEGLLAFVRCVQQDPESGEAWTNMGAIHMRLKNWPKAYHALTEAAKHKREDWRVFENLMMVNIAMSRWKEVIRHMNTLLDMRYKSQRPIHFKELAYLIKVVVNLTHASIQAEKETLMNETGQDTPLGHDISPEDDDERSEERDIVPELPSLGSSLEELLHKMTNSVKSDPNVWDLIAMFQSSLGRYSLALEARTKQVLNDYS